MRDFQDCFQFQWKTRKAAPDASASIQSARKRRKKVRKISHKNGANHVRRFQRRPEGILPMCRSLVRMRTVLGRRTRFSSQRASGLQTLP